MLATGGENLLAAAEDSEELGIEEIVENVVLDEDGREIPEEIPEEIPGETAAADPAQTQVNEAREDFINRIIALGKDLYEKADGKRKRAHYASDIYVCKNFTVYLFRQNREDFRMAEYPDTSLVIPNNLPAKQCKPYAYGFLWEDISAEKGNPFEVGAQFIYDRICPKKRTWKWRRTSCARHRRATFSRCRRIMNMEWGPTAPS